MKKIILYFLAVGLLAIPATLAQAKIVRVLNESFAVESGGTLKVKTSGGDIRVRSGDSNEVQVVAQQKFRTDDEDKADEVLQYLSLTMQKTSDGVELEAKYEGPNRLFNLGSTPVQVSFEVTVPQSYHADLSTSGGTIVVGELGGDLEARTSGGDIQMAKISGPVNASTSGGDIVLQGATGDVNLRTSGGDVEVHQVEGAVDLFTSGGHIIIDGAAGSIRAKTSGGSISAVINGILTQDSRLSTSGGNVMVSVDQQAGFTLDASTSGGAVTADDLVIKITHGGLRKRRLKGEVNGGGPVLTLRTSGGSINVVTRSYVGG